MKLFLQRIKKTGLISLLVVTVLIGCILMTNAAWWLQDNWVMSEWLNTIIMWIILVALACMLIIVIWEIATGLWMLIKWLFIEPFKNDKGKEVN